MPNYKIAHIKEQGVDLIIIPLESRFGDMSRVDQERTIADLQIHASDANLAGTVVPVWDSGGGKLAFIAPQQWHPFFSGLNLVWVYGNLNRELSW